MIWTNKKLSTKYQNMVNNSNLYRLLKHTSKHYFLSKCYLCGDNSKSAALLCRACTSDLGYRSYQCRTCSLPLYSATVDYCPECNQSEPYFDRTYSATVFEFPANTIVHNFKYNNKKYLAHLTAHLIYADRNNGEDDLPDILCCVPMHKTKQSQRGFNQSDLIAAQCARLTKCQYLPNLLTKSTETTSQVGLDRRGRQKNLSKSITLDKTADVHGLRVAVIDDVMTTGATANYIAKLLKEAGATGVEVWVFARTPKPK